jgi:hypothetical protein
VVRKVLVIGTDHRYQTRDIAFAEAQHNAFPSVPISMGHFASLQLE